MNNNEFLDLCKELVKEYTLEHISNSVDFDVYVVWFCKTLQNNKALLGTTLHDKMYYEITYNGDKKEIYLDAYTKLENVCKKIEE